MEKFTQTQLNKFRARAKGESKFGAAGLTYTQALDQIAREQGFPTWADLMLAQKEEGHDV